MGKKISELDALATLATDDLLAVVDTSETKTNKITFANLIAQIFDKAGAGAVPWSKVSKTGSDLADLATRAGTSLTMSATNKILGRSSAGAGAAEEIACTSAGRALLDDSDIEAQRTTLELENTNFRKWMTIAAADYSGTPNNDGKSKWAPNTAYSLDDIVEPSTTNGFLYYCVSAGTSHSSGNEPSWGTTLGADTTEANSGGPTWRCIGYWRINMNTDLTGSIEPGMGLRYEYNSNVYYGYVFEITSTYIRLCGAPLNSEHGIESLEYCHQSNMKQIDFYINGDYGDDVQADLLLADLKQKLFWLLGTAYLVYVRISHITNAGSSNPKINISKNTSNVLLKWDTDKGVTVTLGNGQLKPWKEMTTFHVTNYKLVYDDQLEIECTVADTGSHAANLWLSLVFVFEK